nr:CerR family C-terminal domain-containing protein [Rhizobium sp. L1K21]
MVEAALRLFGEKGYEAVSTREIADHAAANIGSIAYHFGGKPGLRLACADYVMGRIRSFIGPAFAGPLPKLSPAEAVSVLEWQVEQFGRFVATSGEAKLLATFILREVMQPGEVFQTVYSQLFKPVHERMCEIFAMATGQDAEAEEVRLATFCMLGQTIYFRIGRPAIMQRMNWEDIREEEADKIVAVLKTNLRGLIAAYKKD